MSVGAAPHYDIYSDSIYFRIEAQKGPDTFIDSDVDIMNDVLIRY
jgi:hypothetical protein